MNPMPYEFIWKFVGAWLKPNGTLTVVGSVKRGVQWHLPAWAARLDPGSECVRKPIENEASVISSFFSFETSSEFDDSRTYTSRSLVYLSHPAFASQLRTSLKWIQRGGVASIDAIPVHFSFSSSWRQKKKKKKKVSGLVNIKNYRLRA
jgi:hypothetical protein